ncbi:hypothetical protein Bca4012_097545 [Brassica carinata]|uniref:Uncharacterized protein n=1 Tax=Brassica carinata TaxID=52824 RepID=A0A8X7PIF2_BRACI|nr:hypothetical protein Bca52824_080315 [Brassica carinata]
MKYPVVVSKESDEISVYPMYLSVVRISGVTADPSPAEPVRQDEGLRRNPEVYLRWEMNMDKGCCPIKFQRKRGCHKLSKPLLGMPTNGG